MSTAPKVSSSVSAEQVERIVREVLASLSVGNGTSAPLQKNDSVPAVQPIATARASEPSSSVHLNVPVLSLDSLRVLAKDTRSITVSQSTLVTPAAKDFLKEKGITWTRSSTVAAATSQTITEVATNEKKTEVSPSKRLFVTGSVLWLRNLEKQLCPKANRVDQVQIDDAAAVRAVAQAIRSGASSALAIVKAPHSTLWQAARDEALRPAMISQWSDLAEVLREVPTNMLIVPATRWNIAGAANIARKFQEHIQSSR
jgi:hypothetical protein